MKAVRCTEGHRGRASGSRGRLIGQQRGDALLEALFGVLLSSIVGLGLSYTASRMVVSQRYLTAQTAVLNQMSNALTTTGLSTLCAGGTSPSIAVLTINLTISPPTCTTANVTVSVVGGAEQTTLTNSIVTSMTFSTPSSNSTAESLVGGNGVMTISE